MNKMNLPAPFRPALPTPPLPPPPPEPAAPAYPDRGLSSDESEMESSEEVFILIILFNGKPPSYWAIPLITRMPVTFHCFCIHHTFTQVAQVIAKGNSIRMNTYIGKMKVPYNCSNSLYNLGAYRREFRWTKNAQRHFGK
jgi:hypothetical protein